MLELLLIRHGRTDWNVERRVMGAKPIPLNADGRAEVRALAKGLKDIPIDVFYVSPIRRAMQTAQILLRGRDSVPLIQEEGLSEMDYGQWVGRLFDEIGELEAYWSRPTSVLIPDGESVIDTQKRVLSAIDHMVSKHDGGRVAVISHADPIKTVIMHYLGMPLDNWYKIRIDSGSLSVIKFYPDKSPRVIAVNCCGRWDRYIDR